MSPELYDMMPFILGGMMVLLGLLQFLCPRMMTAKKYKDNPEQVAKIKKGGIPMILLGIVWMVLEVVLLNNQM